LVAAWSGLSGRAVGYRAGVSRSGAKTTAESPLHNHLKLLVGQIEIRVVDEAEYLAAERQIALLGDTEIL